MTQLSLLPIARPTDPATSHEAAESVTRDGTRARMMRLALELVQKHPGRTAKELEQLSGHSDGEVRKRLLRHLGRVRNGEPRVCGVSGKRAMVWEQA